MKKKIIGIGSIVVLLIIGCVFYFTREEKIKAVKMVLVDKKSQMEVEKTILGKKEMYRYN